MLVYQDSIPDNQALRPNSLEKEDSVALQQAIRQLTDIDRAIILLHLDGYNNGEIAQMMGISANSLSVKLYRIRQRLANILNAANRG